MPIVVKALIAPFDAQGSTGYYPASAVESITAEVFPVGSLLMDSHREMKDGGNTSYKHVIGRSVSEPSIETNMLTDGREVTGAYADFEIFPDHADIVPKLPYISTSMYLAAEWEPKPRTVNGRYTRVAKRFVPFKGNNLAAVTSGGTGSRFAVEAFDAACADETCAIGQENTEIVQLDARIFVAAEGSVYEKLKKIQVAFREGPNRGLGGWIVDVDDDGFVIANFGDDETYMKIPFSEADGEYVFADKLKWVRVSRKVIYEMADEATRMGNRLRKLRGDADLTLDDVADLMPITAGTIGSIERGDIATPSLPVLEAFAELYDIDVQDLIALLPEGAEPSDQIANEAGTEDFDMELQKKIDALLAENEDLKAKLAEMVSSQRRAAAQEAARVLVDGVKFKSGHEYNKERLVADLVAACEFDDAGKVNTGKLKGSLAAMVDDAPFVARENVIVTDRTYVTIPNGAYGNGAGSNNDLVGVLARSREVK